VSAEQRDGEGSFSLAVSEEGDRLILAVAGELDVGTAPVLRGRLVGLVADGTRDLVVDLADVSFIDSVGLGTLVGALKRLREEGGRMTVRSPSAPVRKVLEITGLTKVLTVDD
jgi:anti-sigma B factor antagonist